MSESGGGFVVDGGVGRGEEGRSESGSESELMSEVESVGGRISDSLLVLGGDLRNDLLVVLVGSEFSLS